MSPVDTVLLPLSGMRLMWHPSGFWRSIPSDQWGLEQTGEWLPDVTDWFRWTGGNTNGLRGEYPPGYVDRPTWWMALGELPVAGVRVTVTLEDGTEPPVVIVGLIWACEWVSFYQPATVQVGDEEWTTAPRERLNPAARQLVDDVAADAHG